MGIWCHQAIPKTLKRPLNTLISSVTIPKNQGGRMIAGKKSIAWMKDLKSGAQLTAVSYTGRSISSLTRNFQRLFGIGPNGGWSKHKEFIWPAFVPLMGAIVRG
jgi:hypothetical protein